MDFIDGHTVENRKGDGRKKLHTLSQTVQCWALEFDEVGLEGP